MRYTVARRMVHNQCMRSDERNGPVSVVGRVATLLGAFDRRDDSVGVSELARRTGLAKTTVHRLSQELVDYGLLDSEHGSLRLGLRLFELGQLANAQRDLSDLALPLMADLREATRQTVHLAVLQSTDVVYIQILRSASAPKLPSRVGGRLPAHATAVGKALLAFSDPGAIDQVIARGLGRVGPRTTTAPGLLLRELARIRANGIATEHEESAAGIVCAASPVLDRHGTAQAALSISGWIGQLNINRMTPAIRTAALSLSRALSSRPSAQ
jgi:IclR family acetate operon transcriptional repressor